MAKNYSTKEARVEIDFDTKEGEFTEFVVRLPKIGAK